ncbi:MAG TPA: CoA ester lyase [Haloplasmataceae bacterium]
MSSIRRSMLFIPGNNPGMLQSADVFDADSVILDLEDSVSLEEKDAARMLVKEVLQNLSLDCEVIVRINPYDSPYFEDDVKVLKELNINMFLLPKASVESVIKLAKMLENTNIKIMVLIETAMGVETVFDILSASDNCLGLMLGGEDLCVDLNCKRTKVGTEILYARSRLVNCAKSLHKFVIDTPFTDTNDEKGLKDDALFAKGLGFDGKAAINPRQIITINDVFSPSSEEIRQAQRIIEAKDLALKQGRGVFALDGKMVDLPIIKRAEKVLDIAQKIGLVKERKS